MAAPPGSVGDRPEQQPSAIPQGYVTRLFGLRDDPKLASTAAGATLLNRPWADWLAGDDELIAALWPDLAAAERTLWNARLFPVAADREESLALALPLQDPAHAPAGWRDAMVGRAASLTG